MVEEDEDEEEVLRVGINRLRADGRLADIVFADNTQEIRDAVRSRYGSSLYSLYSFAKTVV